MICVEKHSFRILRSI